MIAEKETGFSGHTHLTGNQPIPGTLMAVAPLPVTLKASMATAQVPEAD